MFPFIKRVFICAFLTACVAPAPFEEYALAESAIKGARQMQAQKFSPHFYRKARSYFKQGQISFNNKKFNQSKKYFLQAKKMAERAERMGSAKMSKGDTLY